MILIVCRLIVIICGLLPLMNISKTFGKNVRFYRLQKGLSQEDLACLCELHRTYIGSIERGERNITLKNAEKIAIALNESLYNLLR